MGIREIGRRLERLEASSAGSVDDFLSNVPTDWLIDVYLQLDMRLRAASDGAEDAESCGNPMRWAEPVDPPTPEESQSAQKRFQDLVKAGSVNSACRASSVRELLVLAYSHAEPSVIENESLSAIGEVDA